MGTNVSRRSEPEVHVVVVQSQENGQVDAKVLRKSYSNFKGSRMKAGLFVFGDIHIHTCTTCRSISYTKEICI